MNPDEAVKAILDFHEKTNHSVRSVREGNVRLDFSILPRLYKLYRRAETLALPEEVEPSTTPALAAIAGDAPTTGGAPTLEDAAALLKLSAGITKWLKVPNGRMAFRAASCTGALYHIELYLVCGDLPGLPSGVYQYGAQDNALRKVRSGDYRGALASATAGHEAVASAPVFDRVHERVLAERMEVPKPGVPAHLLGLRNDSGKHALGGVVAGAASRGRDRLRGRRREPARGRGRRSRGCGGHRAGGQRGGGRCTDRGARAAEPRDAAVLAEGDRLPPHPRGARGDVAGRGGRRGVATPGRSRARIDRRAGGDGDGGRVRRAGHHAARLDAAVPTCAHRGGHAAYDAGGGDAAAEGRLAVDGRWGGQYAVPDRERGRGAGAGRIRVPPGNGRAGAAFWTGTSGSSRGTWG